LAESNPVAVGVSEIDTLTMVVVRIPLSLAETRSVAIGIAEVEGPSIAIVVPVPLSNANPVAAA